MAGSVDLSLLGKELLHVCVNMRRRRVTHDDHTQKVLCTSRADCSWGFLRNLGTDGPVPLAGGLAYSYKLQHRLSKCEASHAQVS